MKQINPLKVAQELTGSNVVLSERCCGEAGTFAVTRPDIATQVRFRKRESLQESLTELTGQPHITDHSVKILSSCPACQQGLSRYVDETGMDTDYIFLVIFFFLLSENRQTQCVDTATHGGVEKVLL